MRAAHPQNIPGSLLTVLLALMLALSGACTGQPTAVPTATRPPAVTPLAATPVALATVTPSPVPTAPLRPTQPATAVVPQTATPTSCINDLQVILDLSLGDSGRSEVVPAGSHVQKGWRVQNTGACTWDTSYSVAFDNTGNPTWINLTPPARLERDVRPGEMLDVWVSALAPLTPGSQQASWKLVTGSGQTVGRPLALVIETALLPTGTAVTRAWFTAYPEAVEPGGQVALAWSVQDAKAVYLSTLREAWQQHPVESTASRFVFPEHTTTYELHIVNGDDTMEIVRLQVEVDNFEPPRITAFQVQPRNPRPGECVDITWETANRVSYVFIFQNDQVIYTGQADDGTLHHCPGPEQGAAVYWIKVEGPGGEATCNQPAIIP